MVSDFQSAPTRGIGSRLKIQGHPGPHISEFADRGGWRRSKGANLQRVVPSEGLHLRLVVWGENSPAGAGSPIRRTGSPTTPSATAADGSGNWIRQLGETCFPSCFLPVFVTFRRSSTLALMSCLEIRVGDPNFLSPPSFPRAHSRRSRLF